MWLTLFLELLLMVLEPAQKSHVGSETLLHKVGSNEDASDLSRGNCDAPIWLIMWYVWVCDESHIGHILG